MARSPGEGSGPSAAEVIASAKIQSPGDGQAEAGRYS